MAQRGQETGDLSVNSGVYEVDDGIGAFRSGIPDRGRSPTCWGKESMPSRTHDVIVVGGGILGAGLLQGCAARGWRTLGIEREGIAAQTSSRSSKLIHGGLRYLETAQFSLVRESLRERRILRRIAPGLVDLVPFHIPVYRGARRGPWLIRSGLSLYALLGGCHRENRFRSLPEEEWSSLDGITTEGMRAIYRYWDGQTDDAALTAAVITSARALGAEFHAPAEFLRAERTDRLHHVTYRCGEGEEHASAPVLLLAAGPWLNEARARCSPPLPEITVDLIQGTHIEVAGELSGGIYYLEALVDQRPMFVMPWRGRTLVGTTEKRREHATECAASDEEIEYLTQTFAHYFPERDATVLEAWAGLRVLESADGAANRRSREAIIDQVEIGDTALLSIAGGKLTGYRALAEERIRAFERFLPRVPPLERTDQIPLTEAGECARPTSANGPFDD